MTRNSNTTVTEISIPGERLLYGFRESEKYVYHYTSAATLLDKILPTNKLRWSQYMTTNDPKESKEWEFDAQIHDATKHRFEDWPSEVVSAKMNEGLKRRTNVACFSCDGPLTGNHMEDVFQRGWCKPRMWAQYGDKHCGVCLMFDLQKLRAAVQAAFPAPRTVACGRIAYCDRPVLRRLDDPTYCVMIDELAKRGWDEYIKFHLNHSHRRLFFEKNADWSGESEYRFVVWGGEGCDEFVDFRDALSGVMFGASTSEEVIRKTYEVVRPREVFTQRLKWKGCTPWYDIGASFGWEVRYREEQRARAGTSLQ